VKILHVSESLTGGPASYLQEVLPCQTREFGDRNVVLLAPADHVDALAGAFAGIIVRYRRTGRNLTSLVRLCLAFRKAVQHHRPDIVHLHSSFAGALGRAMLLTMRHSPRVLYCAHCWSFDRPRQTLLVRLWKSIEHWLAHRTDRIVNLSPHEQDLLHRAGFPMERVTLIVSGIADVNQSPPPATPSKALGSPLRLLFLGRFDQQKGVDLLLDEYRDIDRSRATLALAGSRVIGGPAIDIPADVTTHGWVPRADVRALIDGSDAVIMPSRWEAMPILALEVLRSGRPLIGSNRGVFPYIIEEGVNGTIIDIDRPGFLDRAITVLERADLAAMGRAARRTYELYFRSEHMNAALLQLYRSLAGHDPSQAPPAPASTRIEKRPSPRPSAAAEKAVI
jgi:glycosyltransferase involved in cell wall biosynthesis